MSGYLPDGCTQEDCDRAAGGYDEPDCRRCMQSPCECEIAYESDRDPTPDDYGERHVFGCVCADCSGAELTASND